jgi:hypothetical protein
VSLSAPQQIDIAMPRAVGISCGSATAERQSLWMARTEAARSLPVGAVRLVCILSKTRGWPGAGAPMGKEPRLRPRTITGGGRVREYQLGAGERQLFASSPSIPW